MVDIGNEEVRVDAADGKVVAISARDWRMKLAVAACLCAACGSQSSSPATPKRGAFIGRVDHKVYISGIGMVKEETVKGGEERFVLVSVRRG